MIRCQRSAEITLRKPCALLAVLLATMTSGSMRCLLRPFSRVGALAASDSLQETRVELAPVRAVEVAQVAVCTQKTMMMTCMAKLMASVQRAGLAGPCSLRVGMLTQEGPGVYPWPAPFLSLNSSAIVRLWTGGFCCKKNTKVIK